MHILSHRGLWKSPEQRNTLEAIRGSFAKGFGTETDLRDRNGELVISHDPAGDGAWRVTDFFAAYRSLGKGSLGKGLPLALNVKADGLQSLIKAHVESMEDIPYFLFDMAVPDALVSVRCGLRIFTRQSELEPEPVLYEEAAGVWMDCFFREWQSERDIANHLTRGKQVCLVSPELHRRPHLPFWERLAGMDCTASDDLLLCTDFPEEAREFFHLS